MGLRSTKRRPSLATLYCGVEDWLSGKIPTSISSVATLLDGNAIEPLAALDVENSPTATVIDVGLLAMVG